MLKYKYNYKHLNMKWTIKGTQKQNYGHSYGKLKSLHLLVPLQMC